MKIRSPLHAQQTRLEIIPLIDIMFFLLASFMMVSLHLQKVRTLKASLPPAGDARDVGDQARYHQSAGDGPVSVRLPWTRSPFHFSGNCSRC